MRARLAKQCLIAIDEHRDARGRVSNEPQHPDLTTDRAWPPEAEDFRVRRRRIECLKPPRRSRQKSASAATPISLS
ncbi:hypothetical protein [Bradyrhizobium valentinum]|uniref:hypothetical protein n=1 Tax=Bradyrhizobium valentinum TaxID=1518501 RepID=UPI003B836B69